MVGKLFVISGYLCIGMCVGGSGDWNLELAGNLKNRGVGILFTHGLSPTSRARFYGQTCLVCDLENRAKQLGWIITFG